MKFGPWMKHRQVTAQESAVRLGRGFPPRMGVGFGARFGGCRWLFNSVRCLYSYCRESRARSKGAGNQMRTPKGSLVWIVAIILIATPLFAQNPPQLNVLTGTQL